MNASLDTADCSTHLKIVATALIAGVVVIWVALAARVNNPSSDEVMRANPQAISTATLNRTVVR